MMLFACSIMGSRVLAQPPVAPEASLLRTISGIGRSAFTVAFSPNGRLLAGAGDDGVVRIWNSADGRLQQTMRGHTSAVVDLSFSSDGQWLASGSHDKSVRVWDVATGGLVRSLPGLGASVFSAAFSPDGTILAAGLADGRLRLWNAVSGAPLRTLQASAKSISSIAFSPDGKLLATTGDDGAVRLWNPSNGTARTLANPSCCMRSLAFSPDGAFLASVGAKGVVQLWKVSTGERVRTAVNDPDYQGALVYTAVAFSPDGQTLATSSFVDFHGGEGCCANEQQAVDAAPSRGPRGSRFEYQRIELRDVRTGTLEGGFNPNAQLWTLAYSIDGQVLATAGYRGNDEGVIQLLLARPFDPTILAAFPDIAEQLAPRDEFETQAEFEARLGTGQRAYLGALRSMAQVAALELAERVRASREEVELPAFSEASGVSLGRYDADRGLYAITVDGRDTSIAIPPAEARELSANRECAVITAIRQLAPDGERLVLFNRELIHPVTQKRYPIGERRTP